ncbi:MAG: glycosyltransferase family 39 protein [Bacteroidota bacterium]
MIRKNLPFVLLTLGMFVLLLVPFLVQHGMFMDGTQYACVARNMAVGKGSFWQPCFSDTWWKSYSGVFLEQPPLGIWLQSLFFGVLGEGLWVERVYGFLMAGMNALFIILIWRLVFKNQPNFRSFYWIAVLFWICIPVCFWSFRNNMLENTMSLFTLAATYFALRTVLLHGFTAVHLLASGLCVFLATLTKGLPGLFPLVVVPVYCLLFRPMGWRKALLYAAALLVVPLACYLLLLLNGEAAHSLHFYVFGRLLGRIGEEPTTTHRLDTLFRMFTELLPTLITVFVVFVVSRLSGQKTFSEKPLPRLGTFFVIMGLAASLPLMLTLVQKGFYFVPALPMFALGLAIFVVKAVGGFVDKMNIHHYKYKVFLGGSVAVVCATLVVSASKIGGLARDEAVLHDVFLFGRILPKGCMAKVDKNVYDAWGFQCYMNRYYGISLGMSDKFQTTYWIKTKNNSPADTLGLKKVDLPTQVYDLYVIKP